MDYSIHDAIEAGFNKIVFIIRHDIEQAFREAIGDRIERICAGLEKELGREAHQQSSVPERLLREMLYFIAISPARSPMSSAQRTMA